MGGSAEGAGGSVGPDSGAGSAIKAGQARLAMIGAF